MHMFFEEGIRGGYSRRRVHDNQQTREGQQQVHERRTQCFHPVHGRQQPLRIGNEPTSYGWEFQMVIVG